MIVQCEHCQTKYRIADEKVKGKGVKVRCTKCENVFTVTPTQDTHRVSEPHPAASAPPPVRDPEPPSPTDKPHPFPSDTPAPPEPRSETPEIPSERAADLPPLPSNGSLPGPQTQGGQEFPDDAFPVDASPGDAPSGGPDPGAPPSHREQHSDRGSQRPAHETDQAGAFNTTAEPPEEEGFQIESTLREDGTPGPDIAESGGDGMPAEEAPEPGPDAGWGNIPIDSQEPADPAGGLGLADGSQYESPPMPFQEPLDEDPLDLTGKPAPETSSIPAYQPEPRASGRGRKAILILIVLSALGGGGYYAYPTVMDMIREKTQKAEGTLTPANIQAKPLNRSDGQLIYIVRGVVRNESMGNIGMIQVEAQFRNASDIVLSSATSYCGNVFPDSELVTLDMEKILSDLQNELGQSLSNASIPPGQDIPFLVVLDNPPSGINKVTVRISSFKETT